MLQDDTRSGQAIKVLLQSFVGILPLVILFEVYYHLIQTAGPGWVPVKVFTLVATLGWTLGLLFLIMRGMPRKTFSRAVATSCAIWLFLVFAVTMDAFIHHRGLSSEVTRTVSGFLEFHLTLFAMFGIPIAFANSIAWLVVNKCFLPAGTRHE